MLKPVMNILCGVGLLMTIGCDDQMTNQMGTTAEGLWLGTTNTNRALTTAVLDDGTYYFFYTPATNLTQIGGVIQGTGISSDGTFTSSNAKDFGVGVSALDATISATYNARRFFNGSLTYTGSNLVSFSTSYNTAYDSKPTLASLAGVYTGQAGSSGGVQTANLTVQSDGTFTGTEQNGCTFTGNATLRTRGNILDQTITFGGAPCFFAGSTFQGVVYFDIATRRLFAAAPNGTRTDASMFLGTKII